MKNLVQKSCVVALLSLGTLSAQAALETSSASFGSPIVVDFNDYDGVIVGAGGATAVSTSIPSVFATGNNEWTLGAFAVDLGDNGLWGAGESFVHASTAPGITSIGFSFGTGRTVQKIGALMSYDPAYAGFLTINAICSGGQLLETYDVTVAAPSGSSGYNEGAFFGISRSTADIAGFSIVGEGLVADNLTFTAPVPEPGEYLMMLAGLGLVAGAVRRNKARKVG